MKPQDNLSFRKDIQALRGLAILLVLLHHAKIDFFKAGYLGVDIFFVVSGFLITQIIRKDLEAGTFNFSSFYFRRAKRLLPAVYVTLFATSILSAAFLTQAEARDYFYQLVGALTFTGNIALWRQTGYFEGAANLKPLLHVWSLSIEEQYYMFLPAALVWLPRRYWFSAMAFLLMLSMVLCFVLADIKPGATFYLLPTRAWELALGSVGALLPVRRELASRLSILVWPALLLLVVIPIVPTGIRQPYGDAAIVCIAALVVILGRHSALEESRLLLPFARLGDFSYSLYLVHWPLFAFANNAYVSAVPMPVNIGLGVVALGIGYSLYRIVELPIRRAPIYLSRQSLGAAIAASLALVLIASGVNKIFLPSTNFADMRRPNSSLGPACEFDGTFSSTKVCSNSDTPNMLVWGDSYAMHLLPAILATTKRGIAQATKSNCGPLDGLAPVGERDYLPLWGRTCLEFNQSVMAYLERTGSVEYVVLSSAFAQYLGGVTWMRNLNLLRSENGEIVEVEPNLQLAVERLRITVAKLRALGKKVVVVAPPPTSTFNIGQCLELKASGKLYFGTDGNLCRISAAAYHQSRTLLRQFLARLPSAAAVSVVDFDGVLCSESACETELNGVFVYRDGGHLSVEGSRQLGIKMGFGDRLIAAAR